MRDTQIRYTKVAIATHWATVLLVGVMFALGWYMVDLPRGSSRGFYFSLHKSLGLLTFLLVSFRLFWRAMKPPPAFPAEVGGLKVRLANSVHKAFYFFLVAQPLTGYLSSSFSGYKTSFFSVPLPHWGWSDPPLNEIFTELHVVSSIILLVLIIMHFLGVLSHMLEGHGHLFRRMWFW